MDQTQDRQEWLEQSTDQAVEAMARWAEASQKALGEMITLGASAATEGLKLYVEAQASALQNVKAGRAYWLRRFGDLQELQKRPV